MSAHTPGPWWLVETTEHGRPVFNIRAESGGVARVHKDDAALLLAAPDLLAALKMICSEWPESRDGMDYRGPLPLGIKAARLAISKAEGHS